MRRDSISAYVHMKRDTPLLLYASVNILDDWMTPPLHSPSYLPT